MASYMHMHDGMVRTKHDNRAQHEHDVDTPLMTRALEFGGGLPVAMGIALAGVCFGVMIGLIVAWTFRGVRQYRKTTIVPTQVPTSLCESAEVRVLESTTSSIESGTSMEALLGNSPNTNISRSSVYNVNGRVGMGRSSNGLPEGPAE